MIDLPGQYNTKITYGHAAAGTLSQQARNIRGYRTAVPALRHAACEHHGPKQATRHVLKTARLKRKANCPGSCQNKLFIKNCLSQNRYIFWSVSSTSDRRFFLAKSTAFYPKIDWWLLRIEFGSYIGDNKFVYHFRTRSQKHRRFASHRMSIISTFVRLWPLQYSRISWAINS
jgi:hypothetical protein